NRDDQIRIVTLIFDDEDAIAMNLLGHHIADVHSEGGTRALFALEADRASHLLDEAFRQRETQSRARRRGATLVKTLEDAEHPVGRALRDPHARIGHLETQLPSFDERTQRDVTTAGCELHRIGDEVEEHLSHAGGVKEERRSFGRLDREKDTLRLRWRAPGRGNGLEEHVERDDLRPEVELAGFDLRQIEDVVDELEEVVACLLDVAEETVLLLG